jgi:hypothetical protein
MAEITSKKRKLNKVSAPELESKKASSKVKPDHDRKKKAKKQVEVVKEEPEEGTEAKDSESEEDEEKSVVNRKDEKVDEVEDIPPAQDATPKSFKELVCYGALLELI